MRFLEYAFANDKDLYKRRPELGGPSPQAAPGFPGATAAHPTASHDDRHPEQTQPGTRREHPAPGLAAQVHHRALLVDFLDSLGIPHKDGAVDDLPKEMDDAKLKAAIDAVLAKHSKEVVTIYLNAFNVMNDSGWKNLDAMLKARFTAAIEV